MEIPDHAIEFATTDDGVSIAYWGIGSGPPLILAHNLSWSHVEAEWTVPSLASFYIRLANRFRLIRYDPRGVGMSQRGFYPDSVSEMTADIEAVAEACGIDQFVMMAVRTMGPVGIEFAVRHPSRVLGLILCNTGPNLATGNQAQYIKGQAALAAVSDDVRHAIFADMAAADELDAWKALGRKATLDVDDAEQTRAVLKWDVESLLREVSVPTLVIRARDSDMTSMGEAQRLATGIPDARLKMVDGKLAPYSADRDAVMAAILDFLGFDSEPETLEAVPSSRFQTVVFTDLVGSTHLLTRLGDDEGRAVFREVEQTVARSASSHKGRVVKNLGDGSLLSFDATSDALAFAVEVVDALASTQLKVRIGVAAGEPIEEDDDLHGSVVVQASRIADLGQGNDIVVSDSVRQLALGKNYTFEPLGQIHLKGFQEAVPIWKVDTQPEQ